MKIPSIPRDSPYSEAQRAWLTGFFTDMQNRKIRSSSELKPAKVRLINILYGTQTGNAESVALDASAIARAHGLQTRVSGMDEIKAERLAKMDYLLIISSTYGEGEMPDNAQMLWEEVSTESAPNMENSHYAVLALGDTNYDRFCQAGKDWDRRLETLGATRIYERVDCDVDFEESAGNWMNNVIPLMASGTDHLQITSLIDTAAPEKPRYSRSNPFPAKMRVNRVLNGKYSSKEIHHFEISIEGSGLKYEAGDAFNIFAANCPDLVEEIIQAIDCQGDEDEPVNGELMTLRQALKSHFEIKLPNKNFIREIARRSGDQQLNGILESGDHDKLAQYLWGRDILDLLLQWPSVNFSAAEFMALLKPLQSRAYSISSSSKKYPETVHLTVSSVRFQCHNREHKGVCSTYLADLVDENTEIPCFFTSNKIFSVPENNDAPIIMVGPGTGIAPFRAFLQERDYRNAKGRNWLFFGDRNDATDFIYREELEAMQHNGLLTRLDLAFSRDQEDKIYVQDRMQENGRELFAWLEEGSYFFVCGDAYRMAKDVDRALHKIIAEQGNLSEEQATEYVNNIKKQKRYVRDVY